MGSESLLGKLIEEMRLADPERIARLENMGIDTSKALVHGTSLPGRVKVINEFAPRTTWLTPDPKFAEWYSAGQSGQTIPVFVPKGEYFDPTNQNAVKKLLQQSSNLPDEYFERVYRASQNPERMGHWMIMKDLHPILQHLDYPGSYEFEKNVKNLAVFDPTKIKSIWAKGKGPGLIGGAAGAAMLSGSPEAHADMNPLKPLGELVDVYRSAQEKVADAVTKQVTQPFGQADEMQKQIMRFGLDPLNVLEGPAAIGAGAVEMAGKYGR